MEGRQLSGVSWTPQPLIIMSGMCIRARNRFQESARNQVSQPEIRINVSLPGDTGNSIHFVLGDNSGAEALCLFI